MTADDLPQILRWLAAPHVAQWWGNPDDQFGLVSEDLAEPAMDQFIVATDNRPFGYLQCYDPTAWLENGLGAQPQGTRGIDQFIGDPDMINRGHGSAFIRVFIDSLLAAGTPRTSSCDSASPLRLKRTFHVRVAATQRKEARAHTSQDESRGGVLPKDKGSYEK